jgi:hypothetical protein
VQIILLHAKNINAREKIKKGTNGEGEPGNEARGSRGVSIEPPPLSLAVEVHQRAAFELVYSSLIILQRSLMIFTFNAHTQLDY